MDGPFGKRDRCGLQRVALGTAAGLLDGPADAAQVAERVADMTDGAMAPPPELAQLGIGLLAHRGVVKVDDGVASLTELGKRVLAWRGVNRETAQEFLSRTAQAGDVVRIRKTLSDVAGLDRSITRSGTDEQKQQLAETRTKVLEVLTDAKETLHRVLAESSKA